MSNLVLHCGANLVDREQVAFAPTPAQTDSWKPMSHIAVLETVEHALLETGLIPRETALAMNPSGKRFFGLISVDSGETQYSTVIGVRNSHDKQFAAGLVAGSRVFVCDNLSFSGEQVFSHRHTPGLEQRFPEIVMQAMAFVSDQQQITQRVFTSYQETEITDRQAEHAIIEMVRRRILPPTKVRQVVKEWDSPRHPEFAEAKNVWRLFNGVTETIKGTQLAQVNRDFRLVGLMNEIVKEAA